jgi:hypothetical protein
MLTDKHLIYLNLYKPYTPRHDISRKYDVLVFARFDSATMLQNK